MHILVKALKKAIGLLDQQHIQYMIIGGLANSLYGEARQTFDIDIKLQIEERQLPDFIAGVAAIGSVMTGDPQNFVRDTGVLPVDVETVRVDFILAQLPYEQQAIARSRKTELLGVIAAVATAEDLIIQKSVSQRNKDWLDIEGIVNRQRAELDWSYIMKNIRELSEFLSDPAIIKRIEVLHEQTGRS
jgi:hypothetical protein